MILDTRITKMEDHILPLAALFLICYVASVNQSRCMFYDTQQRVIKHSREHMTESHAEINKKHVNIIEISVNIIRLPDVHFKNYFIYFSS